MAQLNASWLFSGCFFPENGVNCTLSSSLLCPMRHSLCAGGNLGVGQNKLKWPVGESEIIRPERPSFSILFSWEKYQPVKGVAHLHA